MTRQAPVVPVINSTRRRRRVEEGQLPPRRRSARADARWYPGPQNLAVLRHFALNLLRQERSHRGSIAAKRFTAALDETYLARVLAGVADFQPPVGK